MRILIADDHEMVRDTIAAFLTSEGDTEVVAVADHDAAMTALSNEGEFDLVLLDFNMPGMNGLDGLQRSLSQFPQQAFAILSGTAPNRIAREAVDAGAIGFVPKTLGAKSLLNAIRFMASGETYIPASLLREEASKSQHPLEKQLSRREVEVLEGLCRGLSNKEIARDLDLQEVTIKLHVRTLCKKMNAKNRTQAAMLAKEAGLF
ncbi:response regulator transcription factor [Thalassococcus sp. S3]|uniref:response regulator n=1 Tax=Thalassococcus sp. S3 TaxID=2017482 RepID=UPI0010243FB6|nr:response regulator transcription factor [Thalassococcus sp. S3]QBF30832.1 DNA-binding response regulator [Thalassococcus sp. S3]